MKKEYDYWLLILTDSLGEEHHWPKNFQKGTSPETYCEELLKQDWTTNISGKKSNFISYKVHKLILEPK